MPRRGRRTRRRGHGGSLTPRDLGPDAQIEVNAHEFPSNIDIGIIETGAEGGRAQETFTEYGRSVHFADQTQYEIEVTSNRGRMVAFNVTIDGRLATPTPKLLSSGARRARVLKGFEERKTEETPGVHSSSTKGRCFVARKPNRNTDERVDREVGTIRFEFYEVKYVNRQPLSGRRRRRNRNFPASTSQHSQASARTGVLQTNNGPAFSGGGCHVHRGERMPLCDYKRPLENSPCDITICERVSVTIDFVPEAGAATAARAVPTLTRSDWTGARARSSSASSSCTMMTGRKRSAAGTRPAREDPELAHQANREEHRV